jgi:hypothetical protein
MQPALDIGRVYLSQGNLELAAKYLERVCKSNSVSDDTAN